MSRLLLFSFTFLYFWGFAQNYALVPFSPNGGKTWGIMDLQNRVVVNSRYDSIGFLEGNLGIVVKHKNKYGMINAAGDEIIKPKYSYLQDTCDFVILKENDIDVFHYDKKLRTIMPFSPEIYGLMTCEKISEKEGIGRMRAVHDKYSSLRNFFVIQNLTDTVRVNRSAFISDIMDENLFIAYSKKGKMGAIVGRFEVVKQDDRNAWGVWTTDTLLAIYDTLYANYSGCQNYSNHFKESCTDKIEVFVAQKDGKWGIISPQNKFLTNFTYDAIEVPTSPTKSKYILVKQDGLWGWLSTQDFKQIAPCKYKDIKRVPTKIPDLYFRVRFSDNQVAHVTAQSGKEIKEN